MDTLASMQKPASPPRGTDTATEPGGSHLDASVLMGEIEREVRERLRQRIVEAGGSPYRDEAIFEHVEAMLRRATETANPSGLLLPELLSDDADWQLKLHLRFASHRPRLGRIVVFAKRRILLPLTRWLFEFTQDNFRRQQHINLVLFACVEELARENARLRQDLLDRPRA